MLFNRVFEASFAEVRFRKGAPHLHLGDVRDVIGDDNRFVHFVAFDHQTIEEIGLAVGVYDLPMRIRRLWWDEVIRERQRALAVYRRVRDETLVCFCALEGATLVSVLGKAVRHSNGQRSYGSEYQFAIHAPFVAIRGESLHGAAISIVPANDELR
jgi:hypothetical protein